MSPSPDKRAEARTNDDEPLVDQFIRPASEISFIEQEFGHSKSRQRATLALSFEFLADKEVTSGGI